MTAVERSSHLVLVGPTASGKSAVALDLAERAASSSRRVELISADSMQVYRGMDIGTAKPTADEQRRVRHHLIDLIDCDQEYSVADFVAGANTALDEIEAGGATAIVVGGTGLYIRALVDGLRVPPQFPDVLAHLESVSDTASLYERLSDLDPEGASRIQPNNRRRILRALEVTIGSGVPFSSHGPGLDQYPESSFVMVGIDIDRDLLRQRIESRLRAQMDAGFLSEVEALDRRGEFSRTAAQALGYRELRSHLHDGIPLEEAVQLVATRTRQFAVRQIRWFRRDPRITWFSHDGHPLKTSAAIERHWNQKLGAR